jgi:long-chain fatty acid transport protein
VLLAGRASGAGFDLFQTDTRSTALGGASVGLAADAGTVYDNPANMVMLPGLETRAGAILVAPTATQDLGPYGSYTLDDQLFLLPHVYATWQADERWWLGMGAFSRFGLGTRYDRDWPGQFNSTEATIETFSLNPNLACRLTDELAVAVGIEAMYMDATLVRSLPPSQTGLPAPTPLNLTADSWGVGGNLALAWRPAERVGVGLVYRLPVRQNLSGSAATVLGDQPAEVIVDLPASTTLGVNFLVLPRLNVGAAATYTEWRSFDELAVSLDPDGGLPGGTLVSPKNWRDVWRFSLGAEYALTDEWSLRCGYVYDIDPIDLDHADYIVPPGNRHYVSVGLGFHAGGWRVDVGYTLMLMESESFAARPAEGIAATTSEDGLAHLAGVSVARAF